MTIGQKEHHAKRGGSNAKVWKGHSKVSLCNTGAECITSDSFGNRISQHAY